MLQTRRSEEERQNVDLGDLRTHLEEAVQSLGDLGELAHLGADDLRQE